jgi:hypothetical protein
MNWFSWTNENTCQALRVIKIHAHLKRSSQCRQPQVLEIQRQIPCMKQQDAVSCRSQPQGVLEPQVKDRVLLRVSGSVVL